MARSASVTLFLLLQVVRIDGFQLLANVAQTRLRETTLWSSKKSGGGRASGQQDRVSASDVWTSTPCQPDEARLTIIQITDVYTLEHLASVKTLLAETRSKSAGGKVISMITGDFLAPYLLSSVDRGNGMMNALSKIPIDYITWGNHEVREIFRVNPVLDFSPTYFLILFLLLFVDLRQTSIIRLFVVMFKSFLVFGLIVICSIMMPWMPNRNLTS